MALITGFEYDIFISYRHNDNLDGWVTEFVQNLEKELRSTLKDSVTIYFDKNPHDGLLETHNVDKSLEGKLKCLIFIPIISQTYCDPKSFAWQYEFCAFNKLAKEDQFGRDVKLGNGNVASRILPIKIHDLDADDKTLLEKEMGGVLRAVEFIYKEPGVNRPLKSNDNKADNLNKTDYRNQVNKVANAIKETIAALRNPSTLVRPSSNPNPVPSTQSRSIPWKVIGAMFFLALAAIAGYYFYGQPRHEAGASWTTDNDQPILDKSIAVLPFADLSPEGDQEYLGDGISEEILNVLAQSKELKVIARSSSFQFKGKNEDLRTIGQMLGVATILEGSVRKYKDHIRITAQLINVRDGSHFWSKNYDENTDDIFVIQDKIAASVGEALKVTLLGSESSRKARKWDDQAQRLYQQGRYFYDRTGTEDEVKANELLKQSVARDSTQAISQLYLANSYGNIGDIVMRERHLDKALLLDPDLSEAHAMRALHAFFEDLDFQKASREIDKALTNGEGSPMTLRTAARLVVAWGQPQRAIDFANKAVALDPLQTRSLGFAAEAYYYARNYDLALVTIDKALRSDSSDYLLLYSAMILKAQNNLDEARKRASRIQDAVARARNLVWIDCMQGSAKACIQLHQRLDTVPDSAFYSAVLLMIEGKYDKAIDKLEVAYQLKSGAVAYLAVDPDFDQLREDPRFKKLVEKMNYPKIN